MIARVQPAAAALDSTTVWRSRPPRTRPNGTHTFATHRDATAYHLWGWRAVFRDAFGHDTHYLIARRGGRIAGVLPLVRVPVADLRHVRRVAAVRELRRRGRRRRGDGQGAGGRSGEAGRARMASRTSSCGTCSAKAPPWPASDTRSRCGCRSSARRPRSGPRSTARCGTRCARRRRAALTTEIGGAICSTTSTACSARNMRDLGTPVYSPRFFAAVLRAFPETARVFVVRLGAVPSRPRSPFAGETRSKCPGRRRCAITATSRPTCCSTGRCCGRRSRGRHPVRFRPLDAGRGHVPLQAAVGRQATAAGVGVCGPRGRRCPITVRRTRNSGWRSRCGSGCPFQWRTGSGRSSSVTSPERSSCAPTIPRSPRRQSSYLRPIPRRFSSSSTRRRSSTGRPRSRARARRSRQCGTSTGSADVRPLRDRPDVRDRLSGRVEAGRFRAACRVRVQRTRDHRRAPAPVGHAAITTKR